MNSVTNIPLQAHMKTCEACSTKFESIKANKAALKVLEMMIDIKLYRNETQNTLQGPCSSYFDISEAGSDLEKKDIMIRQLWYKEDELNRQILAYTHNEFSVADSNTCQLIVQHSIP